MAASASLMGLAHDTCAAGAAYPHPPPAASSYFRPELVAGDAAVLEFPPAPAGNFQDLVAARAPDCGYYCSYSTPPPPVFASGAAENEMSLLGYADGDGWSAGRSAAAAGSAAARPAPRIGFRTRSEVDVLDDGFKWRKYGKKAVKSSPNPRNYYRCSVEGCGVKKRVERDRDDPRYVVTTYDGVHNHAAPGAAFLRASPPQRGTHQAASSFLPPPLVTAPWSAPSSGAAAASSDAEWEARLHAAAAVAAAAAHSSESSY